MWTMMFCMNGLSCKGCKIRIVVRIMWLKMRKNQNVKNVIFKWEKDAIAWIIAISINVKYCLLMARIKRFYGSILWKEDNRMMTIRINLKSTKTLFWCHVIIINKYMLLMDFCMLQKLLMPKYQIMFPLSVIKLIIIT